LHQEKSGTNFLSDQIRSLANVAIGICALQITRLPNYPITRF
jgi:hypothetical protein